MINLSNPQVVSLYRYPVKGLSAEKLETVPLREGETIAWDRAYAIENGPGRFDAAAPRHLPKINFLMLMRNERLAALETRFDEESRTLTILRDGKQVARGALDAKIGRQIIEQFIAGYMKDELKGPPRIVSAPGHSFSDVAKKCLHLVNLATVRDVEKTVGAPLDPLRFRANLYFDGFEPWTERNWVGKTVRIGSAALRIFDQTVRCEATNVNPESAKRDATIPATLLRNFDRDSLGVYAEIIEAGNVRPGDAIVIDD